MEVIIILKGSKNKDPTVLVEIMRVYANSCGSDDYSEIRWYYDITSGTDGKYEGVSTDISYLFSKSESNESCSVKGMKEYHYPNYPCGIPSDAFPIGEKKSWSLKISEDGMVEGSDSMKRTGSSGCGVLSSPIFWIIVVAVVVVVVLVVVIVVISRKGKKEMKKTATPSVPAPVPANPVPAPVPANPVPITTVYACLL